MMDNVSETPLSHPDLDIFVRTITWADPESLVSVLTSYLDVLVEQIRRLLAAEKAYAVGSIIKQIETIEKHFTGGSVSALTWPPVAGGLLGRLGPDAPVKQLLRSEPFTPLGQTPAALRAPVWLRDYGPGTVLPPEIWKTQTGVLEPAWRFLAGCGEDIVDFAQTCTRTITLRSTSQQGVTGSWSTDELIGCTVLVNAHLHDEPAFLAEFLVHEAVHHAQGMFEVFRPFIRDVSLVNEGARYTSPWTGAELTAKSFLAACFVWFSLAHLWERAEGVANSRTRTDGIRRAARGFLTGDPASTVRLFSWALDAEVAEVVTTIQETACQRWHAV